MIGKTISHYKILEKLGEGGMGVVYKAEDTKLKRELALKFLPTNALQGKDEKERFIREAQAAAALNHPNIAHIYAIEDHDGQMFLAMELIEGQSLLDLVKTPMPVDDAINYATQIAAGLQVAHDKGIIHRDIKSANIMLTDKGVVKIMDFGLAKLANRSKMTQVGTTLGTTAYMSPEQARGEEVDQRADIWSLGVVLYEMISGQLPFKGDYEQAVIYSILNDEPAPLTALRSGLPISLDGILAKALAKDPKIRYQHVDELPADFKGIDSDLARTSRMSSTVVSGQTLQTPGVSESKKKLIAGALLVIATVVLTSFAVWNLKPEATRTLEPVGRLDIVIPSSIELGGSVYGRDIAVSPDGQHLVFVANDGQKTQLYHRPLAAYSTNVLSGTVGAEHPFFSPDSRWVGFFAGGEIKKVLLAGGSPITVGKGGGQPYGATWLPDEDIIFALAGSGLLRLSSAGGTRRTITTPDTAKGENFHAWPEALPGGIALSFAVVNREKPPQAAILTLATNEWKKILDYSSTSFLSQRSEYGSYVSTGHFVYQQENRLFAAPFDLSRLVITGPSVPIVENIFGFSFSEKGMFFYTTNTGNTGIPEGMMTWSTRHGQTTRLNTGFTSQHPRFSPDGKQVAIASQNDLWIYDMAAGTRRRLTFSETNDEYPVWTPDGRFIAFSSNRKGPFDLHWKRADGSGEAQLLFANQYNKWQASFSPDGRLLAFYEITPSTQRDIWILSLEDHTASPFIVTPYNERAPMFSPDGQFLAYVSDQSGRDEIYVQPYAARRGKWQISYEGGGEPLWSRDGKYLFYRNGDAMIEVEIQLQPVFNPGTPRKLFVGEYMSHPNFSNYDVPLDGQGFLMIKPVEDASKNQIHVVTNWFAELSNLNKTQTPTH